MQAFQFFAMYYIIYTHTTAGHIEHYLECTVIPLTFLLAKEPTQLNDVRLNQCSLYCIVLRKVLKLLHTVRILTESLNILTTLDWIVSRSKASSVS